MFVAIGMMHQADRHIRFRSYTSRRPALRHAPRRIGVSDVCRTEAITTAHTRSAVAVVLWRVNVGRPIVAHSRGMLPSRTVSDHPEGVSSRIRFAAFPATHTARESST
jgi:hypothetical protein